MSTPLSNSGSLTASAAAIDALQYSASPAAMTTRENPRMSNSDTTFPEDSSHLSA